MLFWLKEKSFLFVDTKNPEISGVGDCNSEAFSFYYSEPETEKSYKGRIFFLGESNNPLNILFILLPPIIESLL